MIGLQKSAIDHGWGETNDRVKRVVGDLVEIVSIFRSPVVGGLRRIAVLSLTLNLLMVRNRIMERLPMKTSCSFWMAYDRQQRNRLRKMR